MSGYTKIDYTGMDRTKLGIGVLGYGFMGKAHSNAYLKISYSFAPVPAYPYLKAMCGRNERAVADTAARFGYHGYYTDWRDLIADDEVDIFDNCSPDDLHPEPTIEAAKRGKHLLCEKPLAMTAADAKRMRDAAVEAGVKHMLLHNYRFLPAVRFAKNLIAEGKLGTVYQFRGQYLQEVGHDPAEVLENVWYASGTKSGVLLGIGCHIIDMARFLVGEITSVSGLLKTHNTVRKDGTGTEETVTADEQNLALVEFENGAAGTLESAGISTGRKNRHTWEINGSKGSIAFDLEDPNHLWVCLDGGDARLEGFTKISATGFDFELQVPYLPPGHNAGWEYGHVYALHHFLDCVANDKPVEPYGATFEDGYRIQIIMEAIGESSASGKRVDTLSRYLR